MRSVLIGTVAFSRACLTHLIEIDQSPVGLITQRASSENSDFARLDEIGERNDIAVHFTDDVNGRETIDWLRKVGPDVIFCFGWSRLLRPELLAIPRKGVVGYHPALLPQNRGRHPLIWALVLGLEETGSTFFQMDEHADSGDILSQKRIAISSDDDAGSLYQKMTDTALSQLDELIPELANDTVCPIQQDPQHANTWRKRSVEDGRIDWRMPATNIHNLVRALAPPYPGATARRGEQDMIVWRTRLDKTEAPDNIEPGRVLRVQNREIVVKTGRSTVTLVDHEIDPLPHPGDYL